MTRGKWVLLRGLLGMLGLPNFAFGVYSASLSGLTSANEIGYFRVCANICEVDIAGKSCDLFCTSRRQFTIQSNTVAGERDVVVSVGETRRDACPTPCRHGPGALFCTCDDETEDSDFQVPDGAADIPWENICELFCEETRSRIDDCPECRFDGDHETGNTEGAEDVEVPIRSGRIPRSSMDGDVVLDPRGASTKTDVIGERKSVDADGDFLELGISGLQKSTTKIRGSEDRMDFDWEEFCRIECARGNGGLACNCNIIP